MSVFSILLIALGLAMDAFAVSISCGLNVGKDRIKTGLLVGIYFGGFQAAMPIIGWLAGLNFRKYIVSVDHWIAFVLLLIIGGKMIYEALSHKEEEECRVIDHKTLFILAIATSIDALAVGISFAFLNVSIIKAASIIGILTFIISFMGVLIGKKFGELFKNKAEIAGGIVLIIIGIKIVIEHVFM